MFDLKLFYFFNNLTGRSGIFDWIVIFGAEYLGWFVAVAFLAFLYFSLFSKSEKFRIFLVAIVSMVLSRFIITEIIRFLYCRPRPFMTYTLNQLVGEANCSFPSGHAAFFFALAMAIYFYNKKWGAWFFVVATSISVSRIVVGVHYPSDILGGAVIGILSACIVFRYSCLLDKFIIKN
ncbi:MAG: phosphatase PAP2 family protein [Candidatus Azambacteria bacterium]|nr:phosphatase PAP2 family protein [Candidatus Azambacteria bacterium]